MMLALLLFVFSVMGLNMFMPVHKTYMHNDHANFDDIWMSMLILFRFAFQFFSLSPSTTSNDKSEALFSSDVGSQYAQWGEVCELFTVRRKGRAL